jgi:hypothetical protein
MNGNINLSNGTITWGNNSPYLVLYSESDTDRYGNAIAPDAPTDSYSDYPESNSKRYTGWHTVASSDDEYASYSYDGGETWSIAMRLTTDIESELCDAYGIVKSSKKITSTSVSGTKIQSPKVVGASIYGSNIYGGNIYALNLGTDKTWEDYANGTYEASSEDYTKMTSAGLTTYLSGQAKTFLGQSNAMAFNELPSDESGYCPTLRLGYGSNGQSYVFLIQKDGRSASAGYVHTALLGITGSDGCVASGLKFTADPSNSKYTVDVIGTLNGKSTAVFG